MKHGGLRMKMWQGGRLQTRPADESIDPGGTRFMIKPLPLILVMTSLSFAAAAPPESKHHWTFESPSSDGFAIQGGEVATAEGVSGKSLAFDGHSVLQVKDSADLTEGDAGFTFTAWVNPYVLNRQQLMIAAKNRYSLNERQWGVMIDKDRRFRLYVWQGKWNTAESAALPRPGHWHLVGVVVRPDEAELWVNGTRAGRVALGQPVPDTKAPLTFGGVDDNGRIWQNLFGALDEARLYDQPLSAKQMAALYEPVTATHQIPKFVGSMNVTPDPTWQQQAEEHARQDRSAIVFDGKSPDKLACDTTLRLMPDGSWVMIMLGGGDTEPMPQNRVFITRSHDEGMTWAPMEPIDLGVKAKSPNAALVPSELMVHGDRCTMFVATHDGTFANWKEWMTHSDDSCRTWSELEPAPGRLCDRTFIRNHIVTRDGRILLPFQHYLRVGETRAISKNRRFSPTTNPRNGVLMSEDGGKTWTEHGDIRISKDDNYHGWAENNIVELADGRIAMIIRADRLGGVLYYAESSDGGRTWPEFARKSSIPNPGSKATLYPLGGDVVALLHNANPRHRSPLALWVSFDGLQTWPYQRVLVPESCDGSQGRLNYPDGFVSADKKWLHFAFDDNRHRAVYVGARLPELPESISLWDETNAVPKAAELPVLNDVEFHVIKPYEFNKDGYRFLHGVALAWHNEKLYASFGHNKGGENTDTEEARFRVSEDGGSTWSDVRTIDAGEEPGIGVSHGVFLSHEGRLWSFHGAYSGIMKNVHTRAYTLDESTGGWQSHGTVVEGGFWPMTEPMKMDDGNWIMPGIRVGDGNPAAVAISHGDDLTKWDLVVIPRAGSLGSMWGESSVIVDGACVVNISRYGEKARALAATSRDYGRTWTPMTGSDLPMVTAKPCAGTLSTGQRYLIATTTSDTGKRRAPLTIAVSKPGETRFSKVFVIRHAEFPAGPGESHVNASLAYPYAIERDGKLYVGYSNNGGNVGRTGKGRELWNNNSAELAIIPLATLQVD